MTEPQIDAVDLCECMRQACNEGGKIRLFYQGKPQTYEISAKWITVKDGIVHITMPNGFYPDK